MGQTKDIDVHGNVQTSCWGMYGVALGALCTLYRRDGGGRYLGGYRATKAPCWVHVPKAELSLTPKADLLWDGRLLAGLVLRLNLELGEDGDMVTREVSVGKAYDFAEVALLDLA